MTRGVASRSGRGSRSAFEPLRFGVVKQLGHRDQIVNAVMVDVDELGPVIEVRRPAGNDVTANPVALGVLQPEQRAARAHRRVELAHEEAAADQQVEVAVTIDVMGQRFVGEVNPVSHG